MSPTGIDAYEWELGYDAPCGLFDRDRAPRASADLVRATVNTAAMGNPATNDSGNVPS